MNRAFELARDDVTVGAIILTVRTDAFCSGGDQRIRGDDGYIGDDDVARQGVGRLNVLDLQIQIRRLPKPVIAQIALRHRGRAHPPLGMRLSIAAENARFGQTGPKVGSFDGGYGSSLLARTIGVKRAKELWFLCRQYERIKRWSGDSSIPSSRSINWKNETVAWCRQILTLSPIALRMLKAASTRPRTAWPASSSWPGTRPCSSTCPKRARRVATPSSNTASRIFSKFPKRP